MTASQNTEGIPTVHCPFRAKTISLILASQLGISLSLTPLTTWSDINVQPFNIPAGKLDQTLNRFALKAGIRLHLNAELSQGIYSQGLQGQYSINQGLATLLTNTNLHAELQSDGAYRLSAVEQQETTQLSPVQVIGSNNDTYRDEEGYDAIYDEDISTAYNGKKAIERYKGKDSADIFKGMLNIYSGDARNGGGLDPSIRSIQGPGRVPLSVDSTEQALTVWRGYRGISNRNYIDPNLIGSVQVIKGPSITANVHTSIGGGVVVNTLSASDVLSPGETFGAELKVESSNNAIEPRTPTLLTGKDYRDITDFPQQMPDFAYGDPTLWKPMSDNKNNNPLSNKDRAYRIAFATRKKNYEWLAAYAYRKKGNYFSGSKRSDFYAQPNGAEFSITRINPRTLAHRQRPGYEVPNTSSQLESLLLKAKAKFKQTQNLTLGIRHTKSEYGEIMSSRAGNLLNGAMAQWPLSHVEAKAYNLKYQWQPDNKLIKLQSNLWATDTVSNTNSAGGFPNFANPINSSVSGTSPIIRNTAAAHSHEDRIGFDISNKMQLFDHMNINLAGSYQYHKLRSDDQYNGIVDGWRQWPRAGRRKQYKASVNINWRPKNYLRLNAGMRYSSYWAFDDFLNSRVKAGDDRFNTKKTADKGTYLNYETLEQYSQKEIEKNIATTELRIQKDHYLSLIIPGYTPLTEQAKQKLREEAKAKTYTQSQKMPWLHNGKGKYRRANNPCANGELAQTSNLIEGSCRTGNPVGRYDVPITAKKQQDSGWVPALSSSVLFSENSRVYLRHTQALRYPSLFESTLGFSSTFNPYTQLKPEHAYNYELAYIHNFDNADIKLSYFKHITKDIIEREGNILEFYNIEQQTIRGLEFKGRYDNQRFFTDFGVSYNLENEVCDESLAIQQDPNGSINNCVHAGFPDGYLADQATPKYSANWTIGGRFFNSNLESGVRVVYLSGNDSREKLERDKTTTFDAYINYSIRKNIYIELTGTNLTDLYYIDPLVRSSVPAPGRTVKLSASIKF